MRLTSTTAFSFVHFALAFILFGFIFTVAMGHESQAASAPSDPSIHVVSPDELIAGSRVPHTELQIASGNLGIIDSMVASDARVMTPQGQFEGPAGIRTYVDLLTTTFPAAEFGITDFDLVGSLLIVDWSGTTDGTVVFWGRTLATIDNGDIIDVVFLSQNTLAPL